MSGLDIAVEAYINEHGSITLDAYDALRQIFLEYRDPNEKDQVQASISAMHQREELKKKKKDFFNSIDRFYNKTLVAETIEKLEKEGKDPKLAEKIVAGCKKEYREWAASIKNFVDAAIDELPGLEQSDGEKLIEIMSDEFSYDITSHKELMDLSKKAASGSSTKKTAISKVLDAGAELLKKVAYGATMAALVGSCVLSITANMITFKQDYLDTQNVNYQPSYSTSQEYEIKNNVEKSSSGAKVKEADMQVLKGVAEMERKRRKRNQVAKEDKERRKRRERAAREAARRAKEAKERNGSQQPSKSPATATA